ncbi:type II/IV secretion system protein [Candidatus Peregrinibacteria bacterium]|nr:type II/IV secretion system protein [Candidatus Peregrinibacteria bacterium]
MALIQVETSPKPLPASPVATGVGATPKAASALPNAAPAPMVNPPVQVKSESKMNPTELMSSLQNSVIAGNIPQIVLHMITYATNILTSDIHIEPQEKFVRVRFRVDGVLRLMIEYPLNIHPAVVSRVKIMSGLKIDEQRVPQDGRLQIVTEDGKSLDLRVSTLPTVNGEKIVMRIQDKSKKIPELTELGIQGENLSKMERFLKLPNGVVLVTGPTGSGKTNTLYSVLRRLNQVGVNIMTFEDPVEYQMDGLNQSQMKPEIKYDFATGLRTALRQDPNIIMVGEIRDQETIDIAIRAALTGHLVLSTIHTNSAVGTLTRITDMGVPGFMIASAIRGIIAQRLVRKVCSNCAEKFTPEPSIQAEIRKELEGVSEKHLDPKLLENIQLSKGKGCDLCGHTGSRGRLGVFEILEMDREVGALLLKNAPDTLLMDQAKKSGMVTLKQDGFIKALRGEIPIEEVYRIVA